MSRKIVLLSISLMFFLNLSVVAAADTLEQAIADFQDNDFRAAENIWRDLAEEGDMDALYNLGQMYHLGQGVPFDNTLATEYFLTAAEGGHTAAQRELANIYFFSSTIAANQNAAIGWWQQAAAAGDGRSQYILGVLYFNGDVIPQNMALGFAWTLLAIDAGIAEAVQSETAMRGQLVPGGLARSVERSRTLMTSHPNQADYSLLVAEEASLRRVAPPPVTRVAEAKPENEAQLIAAEAQVLEPEPTVADPIEMAGAETAADEIPQNALPDDAPEIVPDDIAEQAIPDQDIMDRAAEPDQASAEETFSENILDSVPEEPPAEVIAETTGEAVSQAPGEQAAAGVIEMPLVVEIETAPVEAAPVTVRDLGDPLSPLVDPVGFEGQWRVQVTSFRLPENAEQHWRDVNAKHPEIFAGVEKRIVRFDLGPERGVYYRLRVGPFESKEAADLKCQELTDAAMGCLVIWP